MKKVTIEGRDLLMVEDVKITYMSTFKKSEPFKTKDGSIIPGQFKVTLKVEKDSPFGQLLSDVALEKVAKSNKQSAKDFLQSEDDFFFYAQSADTIGVYADGKLITVEEEMPVLRKDDFAVGAVVFAQSGKDGKNLTPRMIRIDRIDTSERERVAKEVGDACIAILLNK